MLACFGTFDQFMVPVASSGRGRPKRFRMCLEGGGNPSRIILESITSLTPSPQSRWYGMAGVIHTFSQPSLGVAKVKDPGFRQRCCFSRTALPPLGPERGVSDRIVESDERLGWSTLHPSPPPRGMSGWFCLLCLQGQYKLELSCD